MSGRPPPLPPTAWATEPTSFPACTFEVKSFVTPETMDTFESSDEASTTTMLFHLARNESTNVRSAANMSAPAQFSTEIGNGNDADFSAVLLAEQGHRAGVQRVIEVHHVRVNFGIFQDALIHQSFDLG